MSYKLLTQFFALLAFLPTSFSMECYAYAFDDINCIQHMVIVIDTTDFFRPSLYFPRLHDNSKQLFNG